MSKYKIAINEDAALGQFCAGKTCEECKTCILRRNTPLDGGFLCMINHDKKKALKILEDHGIVEKVPSKKKKYTFKASSLPLNGMITVETDIKESAANLDRLLATYCMSTSCRNCFLNSQHNSTPCYIRGNKEKLSLLIASGDIKEEEADE